MQRSLLLQALPQRMKIEIAALLGDAGLLEVDQRFDLAAKHRLCGQAPEIVARQGILLPDPGGDLAIAPRILLEPAIGIGDLPAEMAFGHVDAARMRIDRSVRSVVRHSNLPLEIDVT